MMHRWKHGEELARVECGVNYAKVRGRFVSVSVTRDDGGTEWLSLTPDEAETLADTLHKMAQQARAGGRQVPPEEPG